MKILIVGLGSIGRRHLALLQKMEGIELAALRSLKGTLTDPSGITEFYTIDKAIAFKPDGVIISSPTSKHIEDALPFLKIGCKLLIEKPIAQTLEQSIQLSKYAGQLIVAYCMRFLPIYQELGKIFEQDVPFKVGFRRSYYLPKWHPYADYRKEYTARKELGGGVVRTLSHEIDLAIKWFGNPVQISGITDQLSHLEINTDDYAFFTIKSIEGIRSSFELDFYSPINVNEGEAYTLKGKYNWTINEIKFCGFSDATSEVVFAASDHDINNMYLNQINDFIYFIKENSSENSSYNSSLEVLKIIEEIER